MKSSHLKSNYMSVVSIYEVGVSGRDFGYPPIFAPRDRGWGIVIWYKFLDW